MTTDNDKPKPPLTFFDFFASSALPVSGEIDPTFAVVPWICEPAKPVVEPDPALSVVPWIGEPGLKWGR
jgi:hypothetical protein